MPLSDAVLEIAQQMEEELVRLKTDGEPGEAESALRGFARQLRSAVKASEGALQSMQATSTVPGGNAFIRDAEIVAQHALLEGAKKARFQEAEGIRYWPVADGPALEGEIPLSVPLPGNAAPGGFALVGKYVYEVRADGKLYYHEEQTKLYQAKAAVLNG